jgi:4-hydroxy 2-oxovalerate aldolase
MEIIDVTLRDGGHAVDFDWPIDFAREYYDLLSNIPDIKTIELGYWGQTSKTTNPFYNLNMDKVANVTLLSKRKNVSIMIDYHYCSHDLKDYPTNQQNEISMIRMCSRKEDMKDAIEFGRELKAYTKLNVSFNIFNAANYSEEEILDLSTHIREWPFDYLYFADTHGSMDLSVDWWKFDHFCSVAKYFGKKVGFHLHDHSGMAMSNYRQLLSKSFVDSTDTSIRGMGKGSGNLKLEYVLQKKYLPRLAKLIIDYDNLLTISSTPYELITAKYAISDNYAKQASELKLDIFDFDKICSKIEGIDKDSFRKEILDG